MSAVIQYQSPPPFINRKAMLWVVGMYALLGFGGLSLWQSWQSPSGQEIALSTKSQSAQSETDLLASEEASAPKNTDQIEIVQGNNSGITPIQSESVSGQDASPQVVAESGQSWQQIPELESDDSLSTTSIPAESETVVSTESANVVATDSETVVDIDSESTGENEPDASNQSSANKSSGVSELSSVTNEFPVATETAAIEEIPNQSTDLPIGVSTVATGQNTGENIAANLDGSSQTAGVNVGGDKLVESEVPVQVIPEQIEESATASLPDIKQETETQSTEMLSQEGAISASLEPSLANSNLTVEVPVSEDAVQNSTETGIKQEVQDSSEVSVVAKLAVEDDAQSALSPQPELTIGNPIMSVDMEAAVKSSDRQKVTELLAAGADVDATNAKNQTALYLAAQNGDSDLVRLLIDSKADVNNPGSRGRTPLLNASVSGDYNSVQILLENGANTNTAALDGKTPLMAAAWNDLPAIAQALINRGANPNQVDKFGRSALFYAIWDNHAEVIELLLLAGADPNIRDNAGVSSIQVAQSRGVELFN